MEYFEELLKRPSLFKDESKLDINYIPEKLPHRDKELSLLSQLFLGLITNPSSISRKILITGKTGIGKTATIKLFGEILEKASKKRQINVKYVHVNCRKERTSYKVLIRLIQLIDFNFPKRGYSSQDLLDILIEFLQRYNLHILIVLDELSYLINKHEDLIYSLTRVNDDTLKGDQRLSIIGIVRDISCLNHLDNSTISTLQRNIIKFKKYSKNQIFDIFKYRADISLKKNVISDDIIDMISENTFNSGDIRYGLNILWRSCKIAESKNLKYIDAECIRLGTQDLLPFSALDILEYMNSQKLTFLLAIIKALDNSDKIEISFIDALKRYYMICENSGLQPRSDSQLWNYLQEFKRENIIVSEIISERIKGRRAIIKIPDLSLRNLEKSTIEILNSKGIEI
ncbi:MAG: AAA family ATPase [Candidatus Lokiarchaeota archaeon]|nr:AAA family ATPase [Candidatus Lokiarchaeota archaeon]